MVSRYVLIFRNLILGSAWSFGNLINVLFSCWPGTSESHPLVTVIICLRYCSVLLPTLATVKLWLQSSRYFSFLLTFLSVCAIHNTGQHVRDVSSSDWSRSNNKERPLLQVPRHFCFNSGVSPVTMQPPVVNMTDCSFFLRSFKQSKAAVRLKEDMKKIVAVPLNEQRSSTYKKLFGVSLQDLQQQGLTENGIPAIVENIVEYLTKHGKLCFNSGVFTVLAYKKNAFV